MVQVNEAETIFVGSKPLINYVSGIVMQFNTSPEVIIKSRGKFTAKAIDVVELAKKKFKEELTPKSIEIGSEQFQTKEGKKVNVSTLKIVLKKV
jgi:DNA-binding protein